MQRSLIPAFSREMALRASRLNDLSPLNILGRGFALARDGEGRIVKSVAAVSPGDALSVRFADGTARARVEEIEPLEPESLEPESLEPYEEG